MTEPTPDSPLLPEEHESDPGTPMPRWVPVIIGVMLVVMAGLAVYTGLRYRNDGTLDHRSVRPQRDRGITPHLPASPAPAHRW